MTDPGRAYLYSDDSLKGRAAPNPPGRSRNAGTPAAAARSLPQPTARTARTPPSRGSPAKPGLISPQHHVRESVPGRSGRATPVVVAAGSSAQQAGEHTGDVGRWGAALGNLEDARVALDSISRAIDDAVYLDEDAYKEVAPVMQYMQTIQGQQRRIDALQAELQDVRGTLLLAEAARHQAEQHAHEIAGELENNTVVFKMHYTELMARDAEIMRLKAVIEGLALEK